MKKKVGFLVQKDFLITHFGVRNFFSTIMDVCAERYQTDYIIYDATPEGGMWFVCSVPMGYEKKQDPSPCMEYNALESKMEITFDDFLRFAEPNRIKRNGMNEFYKDENVPTLYLRSVGENLGMENYDLIVITNPWIVGFETRLPAKKVIGIVHDIIPNLFSLTGQSLDFTWGHKHHNGYKYYNGICDGIYANSKNSADQYNEFYLANKCNYFKPFMPYAFKNAAYTDEKKENAMLLAAPFDTRKGIDDMPELINGAADLIDTLYIYGMPRCPATSFDQFFESIHVKRIVYSPYIRTSELISLYQRCKVLLFPSVEEGLGIPIIEAQVCGCRVVTTDKKPMNELVNADCYLLTQDKEEDIRMIRAMMQSEHYDYAALSRDARERFSHDDIRGILDQLLQER